MLLVLFLLLLLQLLLDDVLDDVKDSACGIEDTFCGERIRSEDVADLSELFVMFHDIRLLQHGRESDCSKKDIDEARNRFGDSFVY